MLEERKAVAPLTSEGLEAVLALQALCPEVHAWTAANWGAMLAEAQEGGAVRRGTLGLWGSRELLIGVVAGSVLDLHGELEMLMVHPAQRHRGLGRRLSLSWLRWAQAHGAQEILLEVRWSNAIAQQLYRQLGFKPVARRAGYYSNPVEDASVMCKRLSGAPK